MAQWSNGHSKILAHKIHVYDLFVLAECIHQMPYFSILLVLVLASMYELVLYSREYNTACLSVTRTLMDTVRILTQKRPTHDTSGVS